MRHPGSPASPVSGSPRDDGCGFVIRVVEDLDLETVAGPIQLAHGIDDAFRDVALVVDGDLDAQPRLGSARDQLALPRP